MRSNLSGPSLLALAMVLFSGALSTDILADNVKPETASSPVATSDLKPLAQIPTLETGDPAPGKRVSVTEPEYAGTDVHHSLYLPTNFADHAKHPLIVEYTGNAYPKAGSTGRVEDAHLGFNLTLGRDFIWVVLPFVAKDHLHNEVIWWGDEDATVAYAKKCIPRIIAKYHGDPDKVILCGFSRGAIAAGYIGLHDDDISKLWSAFFTTANFDGVGQWKGTTWGFPHAQYGATAISQLQRVKGRPWWITENKSVDGMSKFLKESGLLSDNYVLEAVPMAQLFPKIPNPYFIAPHTDMWPLFDNESSRKARAWIHKMGGLD